MKLSIIIPLYNKEKYIGRCLKSLLAQDLSIDSYEVIIIDDGSTDSSFSIAQGFVDQHSNIHLHKQKNAGPGAARNKGLDLAKGDYVYFLDADDYIATNVLNRLIELSENNKLEILGFNTNYVKDDSFVYSSTLNIQDLSVTVMDGMTYIAKDVFRNEAWWYIIKRSFLKDSGIVFTEGRFIEDTIFTANLFLKVNRISKVNFDVHRFVKVENSATTNTNPNHTLKLINDLVYGIEMFDTLIKGLDSSNDNYNEVVNVYKSRQHSFVFSLFIKVFRCPILKFEELNEILLRLKDQIYI
jgi:glycosyltransferase involved in cell wall biosynthesis